MEEDKVFLEVFMNVVDCVEKIFNKLPKLTSDQIELESKKILKNLPEVRFFYTGNILIAGDLCIGAIIKTKIPNDCFIKALNWSISLNPYPVISIQSFKLLKESCAMPYNYSPIQFHFGISNRLRKLNLSQALHTYCLKTPLYDKTNLKATNHQVPKPSRNLQISLNPTLRITQFDSKSLDYIKNYLDLMSSL